MPLDRHKIPCRVVTRKKEDGDELIFVFKDFETAQEWSDAFPWPFFQWISFEGAYDSFWCKRTTIH